MRKKIDAVNEKLLLHKFELNFLKINFLVLKNQNAESYFKLLLLFRNALYYLPIYNASVVCTHRLYGQCEFILHYYKHVFNIKIHVQWRKYLNAI